MNLFKLVAMIGLDTKEYEDKVKKTTDDAKGFSSKLGGYFATGVKAVAKSTVATVAAAASAVGVVTKIAIENYAEYEQLVDGARLMFGNAYETVSKNAQDAYKTVQMSQNEYLQQVNGFATGLKTALGENEQAAADLAHSIVKAEADIIAATGNTAENVQNAFNGIMKSNFTMLDNLQIGITPTKEGFQEVIDKVNEWNEANGEATSYQMDNLADMQSALVDYIEMVGMSGYAQNEASQTIAGSLSSAKAAWSNLVTGLADDTANLDPLITGFVESVGTVAKNVIPKIGVALNGAAKLIRDLIPVIVNEIPGLIEENLPILAEAAVGIVESLADGISNNLDSLMSVIIDVVVYIVNSLLRQLPKILKLGLNLIITLAKGIAQAIPQLLPTIVEVITEIVSMISDPAMLSELLDAALEIIMALSDGLVDAIPQLLQAVSILMQGLYTFFLKPENMVKMAEAGINLIIALGAAVVKSIPVFLEYWVNLITSIVDNFKNTNWSELGTSLVESIKNGISRAWAGITQWFNGIWNQLFGNRNVNINVSKGASGVVKPIMPIMYNGSHAMGLDYVPFDGYIAELHKGERILTAKEAKEYGKSVSFGNVIIQVDGRGYDEERLAVAISERLQIMTERRESVFA